jgi:hypothetical protein
VTVHSEYYQAWAAYFRTRTEGQVEEFHSNETVELTLETGGVVGDFSVPPVGDSVTVTGMGNNHSVNNFTVTIHAEDSGNPFNNRHWSFYSSKGGQEFELHMYSADGCGGGGHNGELEIGVYYYNGTTNHYQGWENETVYAHSDDDFEVDCTEESITMNFTSDTHLEYQSIDVDTGNAGWEYASEIDSRSIAPTVRFDDHSADTSGGRDGIYNASSGETDSMHYVVNHYLSLLGPSFELIANEGPGGSTQIDPDLSSGTLDYDQSEGNLITFLHITENRIRVEFR